MHLPWSTCLMEAGRGFGKTFSGAHWTIERARKVKRGAIVGPTLKDVRQTMVEEGILAVAPPDFTPTYKPGLSKLIWPNGHETIIYTADRPDRLRGPNLGYAWCDEVAAWRFLREAWKMLKMCLRKSKDPRTLATSTPRATEEYEEIRKAPSTHLVRGTTFDNLANLSAKWFRDEILPLLGTTLGRQEILAELLAAVVGALLTRALLDKFRVNPFDENGYRIEKYFDRNFYARKIIGVDPQAVKKPGAETGIVCVARGHDGCAYTLEDYSLNGSPDEWAAGVINAYLAERADAIAVEKNHGGDMVTYTLKTYCRTHQIEVPRIIEVFSSQGKLVRAEPFQPMFEAGQAKHVGTHAKLEDQWCTFVPGESKESPNRMDAEVFALAELFPRTGIDVLPISRLDDDD